MIPVRHKKIVYDKIWEPNDVELIDMDKDTYMLYRNPGRAMM